MLYYLSEQPDLLGVSETQLNANTTFNTELINYKIYQTDSPTPAGGVALYVSKALTWFPRSDITLDMAFVESEKNTSWLAVSTNIQVQILMNLNGKLDVTMKLFNPNKYQLYILGDMNIDLFKSDSHSPTEAYLDMLYSNNLLLIITTPTRLTYHSATLIDHIYTNSTSKIVSAIIIVDISYHLPVVCVANIPVKKHNPIKYYRDYNNFVQESYLRDINVVNWNAIYSNDLHETTTKITDLIKSITDKHAPIRQLSQNKQKLCTKPWISNVIIHSKYFLCSDWLKAHF